VKFQIKLPLKIKGDQCQQVQQRNVQKPAILCNAIGLCLRSALHTKCDSQNVNKIYIEWISLSNSLQCFDAVGWTAGRASGL